MERKVSNELPECKNCNNCDLYSNECLIDGSKCYENQVCIHKNCENYKEGEWRPQ